MVKINDDGGAAARAAAEAARRAAEEAARRAAEAAAKAAAAEVAKLARDAFKAAQGVVHNSIAFAEKFGADPAAPSGVPPAAVADVAAVPTTATKTDLSKPPPGYDIPPNEWRSLPTDDKQACWDEYNAAKANPATPPATAPAAGPTVTITNQALYDYLQANPNIKTVQDFVNATYPKGTFESTCKQLGLDPVEVAKYRSAKMIDLATVRLPPTGTLPTTVADADAYHMVEFNTAPYGTGYNNFAEEGKDWSNGCGPCSLAMALREQGKMPADLNPQQQEQYARALISGNGTDTVINGKTYKLDTSDGTLGYGEIVNGAKAAGLNATHAYGWDALDDALAAGNPVVAAGNITSAWKAEFSDGHYGSTKNAVTGHFIAIMGKTADGKYIVSDPMFTGGPVTMTKDQLQVFMGEKPDITTIGG